MKTIIQKTVLFAFAILCIMESNAQLTFSVSPGFQLNGASFGYKTKKFVPFIGAQLLSAGADYSTKGQKYDSNVSDIVSYENKYKFTGTIFMPTIGVKYFFKESNKLKAYGLLSYTKCFLSGKIEDNNNPTAGDDFKEAIKNTKVFGGQLGFGTEYFFDDNFSLGGEFGLRLLHVKSKSERNEQIYNPNTGQYVSATITNSSKFSFKPTYVKVSLNFYFAH